jgi:hypothetical protein
MPERLWHPIQAAYETSVGTWEMRGHDRVYGEIRLVTTGRPHYWAQYVERDGTRVDLQRWNKLAAACLAVHRKYVSTHGPRGPWNGNGNR